jgi:hypothetical protein
VGERRDTADGGGSAARGRQPGEDERLTRRRERFAAAPDGAFVWTKDADGLLWLGRIAGGIREDRSPEAIDVDLIHVRPCRWLAVPVEEPIAPPAVRATFRRGGRNWQEIHNGDVSRLSAALWDERVGERS